MRTLFLALLALAGCDGKPPPEAPVDPTLQREQNAGRASLSLERPAQAIENYQAALVRARLRDDPEAIADMGFNLAVAQLRANLPAEALETTRTVRAELARRGTAVVAVLDLAEATALYRTGNAVRAIQLAESVRGSTDPATAARAAFLLGIIADDRGDLPGLRAARVALPPAGTKTAGIDEAATDAAELDARIALRSGQAAEARDGAAKVVKARRDMLDYRGLTRALALEAAATDQIGDRDVAADLYLRAGRGAATQNDRVAARLWLGKALAIGRNPEVLLQARAVLTSLEK